ncbi:hypothetical protein RFI_30023 [Reticulomyxa filosa]|uniref:Uncharacterized protein n=1 Tax=Reticulomyxa filosa TaxID=46433 RepID=X6M0J7_RETFI|nr:hypothetical protein RFI_30023 [Reticulomyxa filosa]|eukprot:ETO07369.1 hypothetical protein RFI_30023 [Reticulomyxa filosa]
MYNVDWKNKRRCIGCCNHLHHKNCFDTLNCTNLGKFYYDLCMDNLLTSFSLQMNPLLYFFKFYFFRSNFFKKHKTTIIMLVIIKVVNNINKLKQQAFDLRWCLANNASTDTNQFKLGDNLAISCLIKNFQMKLDLLFSMKKEIVTLVLNILLIGQEKIVQIISPVPNLGHLCFSIGLKNKNFS